MIARLAYRLEKVLEGMSVFLVLSMTFVIVFGVIMRKTGSSLIWYDEVASLLLVWITYYGAATAAIKRSHLGFSGLLYSAKGTLQSTLFWVSEIIVIGFFALVAFYGWTVLEYFEGETLISLPWVSVPFVQSVIPIGAILFIFAELLSIPQALQDMCEGRDHDRAELEEYAEECGIDTEDLFPSGEKTHAHKKMEAKS
ncbi:TRAP transporter small permease [Vibrio penaeicida]|uniref:TRAP transporter small permease n=1 Tax=Vibrio penaeicida TaxID=104609 RepID=UPI002734528E|nr:TRAP transporter small permease [Vibrio penaeicida]MDP2574781.1 TRAP transporter small permease [Vibrio penaeicida]